MTAREQPDVALVRLGDSSEHALELIDRIVNEAACPVIALTKAQDPTFVGEASKRGVFAYIDDTEVESYQSSIDVALRPLRRIPGPRRSVQASRDDRTGQGDLDGAPRHRRAAFRMLRHQSHTSNLKIINLASAVIDGHLLLRTPPREPTPP